jgi:hypothetical protein
MASAELSRRVEKVVGYPPLVELDDLQRREFHGALLEAGTFEDLPGKLAGGDPGGGAEPAGAPRRHRRLSVEALVAEGVLRAPSTFRVASSGGGSPGWNGKLDRQVKPVDGVLAEDTCVVGRECEHLCIVEGGTRLFKCR